jgi:hypothetical protein
LIFRSAKQDFQNHTSLIFSNPLNNFVTLSNSILHTTVFSTVTFDGRFRGGVSINMGDVYPPPKGGVV